MSQILCLSHGKKRKPLTLQYLLFLSIYIPINVNHVCLSEDNSSHTGSTQTYLPYWNKDYLKIQHLPLLFWDQRSNIEQETRLALHMRVIMRKPYDMQLTYMNGLIQ